MKANYELESIKDQLTAILESSYDGIYITDGEGRFLNINDRLMSIIGCEKENAIGTYAQDLVKEGILNKSVVEMVIDSKERTTINQSLKGKTIKEIMVTATPILDKDGEIKYIVANVRDMTDLTHMENECNKAKSLSRQYYSELIGERGYVENIIAESTEMKRVIQLAYQVAQVDSNVLLEGESGTGKDVIARFIHEMSPRNKAPLISINCAGIPETLLEAELFGYEEGSFTGAKKGGKVGLIELADGGTLFLDELNSLPIGLQGKLLRVIETYDIKRLGSRQSKKINFRLVAMTNKNLRNLVSKGLFRKDLYFRVNTIPIVLPPLRRRKKDVVPLALHFLKYFNKKFNYNKDLSASTLKYLEAYNWPGNVRELKNTIERLIVMTDNDLITEKDLPNEIIGSFGSNKFQIIIRDIVPLKELTDAAEAKLIKLAMERFHTTREAAKALKISQTSVVRKVNKLSEKNPN